MMIGWYKGESWRVLPNIEISYNEEEGLIYFTFVIAKFVFDLPILIKWKGYGIK